MERKGTLPLRGRTPEKSVADWINKIKREMDVDEVVSVIVDGKKDITKEVNKL